MSWREHAPEPARLWIRWSPRHWSAPPEPCLDLAARRLAWPSAAATGLGPLPPAPPRVDLLCLPPVSAALVAERGSLARALSVEGCPVLLQSGAEPDLFESGAALIALDFTALLLASGGDGLRRLRALPARPRAGETLWAVLPLIAGVTPTGAALEPWLDAIGALAPDALALVTPELQPLDRRWLAAALADERYETIFHGVAPTEREVARGAARRGIDLFPRRPPAPGLGPRAARNRELAAALAEAGELWLRLGRAEPEGQGLLAAARHLESTPLDLAALAREGNLAVVDWLSADARELVAGCLPTGESPLLERLRAAWLADQEDDLR